jgi:hypothetical protein
MRRLEFTFLMAENNKSYPNNGLLMLHVHFLESLLPLKNSWYIPKAE